MNYIKGAWSGLDNTGRIVLIVAVTIVIIAAIYTGVDLSGYLN